MTHPSDVPPDLMNDSDPNEARPGVPDKDWLVAHADRLNAEATSSTSLDQPGTGAGYTAVEPAHPAWLLDLVHAAETAADETVCNSDHEGNDGCDGCAWAGLIEAVPVRLRNAADERASKGGAW